MKYIFVGDLNKDLQEEFMDVIERKSAVEDLCLVLAENNELFQQNSDFYECLINDNIACLKNMTKFWKKCEEVFGVKPNSQQELYLNYFENKLYLREKTN